MKLKALFASSLLAFSLSSHAELVTTDYLGLGDSLSTLDTETGYEWLDISQTFGLSVNQVKAKLETDLAGWRIANQAEITSLFDNHFGHDGASYEEVSSFYELFNTGGNGTSYAFGVFEQDGQLYDGGVRLSTIFYDARNMRDYTYGYDAAYSYYGTFLVNDGGVTLSSINDPSLNVNNPDAPINQVAADVPVSLGFGALALFGLGLTAQRRIKP